MSSVEQTMAWTGIAAGITYIVLYQFFFIPHLNEIEPFISVDVTFASFLFSFPLFIFSAFQIFRDLNRRKLPNTMSWVLGLLCFSVLLMPYYLIKHGRRPLPDAT
jgi:hypothetical protein